MKIKTIHQIKNFKNKTVLLRCDFDVPIREAGGGRPEARILDDYRLKKILPTIEYLLDKKCQKIILIGHLGRPGGKFVKKLSLEPVRKCLEKKLKQPTVNSQQLTIKLFKTIRDIRDVLDYKIVMLENLRFWSGEEKNDEKFAKKLASLADVYINEAFAVSHRQHASVDAIKKYLPIYYGLNFIEEIKNLNYILQNPKKPFVAIIGGAKIETKLPVIKKFLKKADYVLVGGKIANELVKNLQILNSKFQINSKLQITNSKQIQNSKLKNNNKNSNYPLLITQYSLLLPIDGLTDENKIQKISEIKDPQKILDIGPDTIKMFCAIIKKARTIVWNGPLGKFEDKRFSQGTKKITDCILQNKKARIIIGGGETVSQLTDNNQHLTKNIFISTGGGAMLNYLTHG